MIAMKCFHNSSPLRQTLVDPRDLLASQSRLDSTWAPGAMRVPASKKLGGEMTEEDILVATSGLHAHVCTCMHFK